MRGAAARIREAGLQMKRFLLIGTSILLCVQAQGQVLYVPSEYSKIQLAINDANDWDTVIVSQDRYQENINFLGKAITVQSTDPNDPDVVAGTIIDGNAPTDSNFGSVVIFNSGEDANSVLSGFTITGGTGSWLLVSWEFLGLRWNRCGGGAVCYNMSAPTITKNVFTGNTAGQGGGIYIYGDPVNPNDPSNPSVHVSPIVTDNTFIDNSAFAAHGFAPPDANYPNNDHGDGGAIVGFQGVDAIIKGNLIENNHADYYGGAIHLRQWSDGEICKNQILSNDSLLGAGIHITYTSAPLIADNLIESNISPGGGGGIYVFYYSDALIERNFITQNESSSGAGIAVYTFSEPQIHNNLVVKNTGLGILCQPEGAIIITGNTISDNYPYFSSGGGGIYYMVGDGLLIENNIITSNDDFGISGDDSAATIRYNDVWGSELGNYGGELSDQNEINGNISVEPLFVDDQNDDYHLKSNGWRWDTPGNGWQWDDATSRCIDAGNPGYVLAEEPLTVPDDPDGQRGKNLRINMGAYGATAEASLPPLGWMLHADITNDGIVDFTDLTFFVQSWFEIGQNIPADLNRDQTVNLPDFAIFANDWLSKAGWYE
ncbi:hypothetical protein ES703_95526 [subsurface metagenome]